MQARGLTLLSKPSKRNAMVSAQPCRRFEQSDLCESWSITFACAWWGSNSWSCTQIILETRFCLLPSTAAALSPAQLVRGPIYQSQRRDGYKAVPGRAAAGLPAQPALLRREGAPGEQDRPARLRHICGLEQPGGSGGGSNGISSLGAQDSSADAGRQRQAAGQAQGQRDRVD